jgi:hypothetical protein
MPHVGFDSEVVSISEDEKGGAKPVMQTKRRLRN